MSRALTVFRAMPAGFGVVVYWILIPLVLLIALGESSASITETRNVRDSEGIHGSFLGVERECSRTGIRLWSPESCSWLGTFTPEDGGRPLIGARLDADLVELSDGQAVPVIDVGTRDPTVVYIDGDPTTYWLVLSIVGGCLIGLLGYSVVGLRRAIRWRTRRRGPEAGAAPEAASTGPDTPLEPAGP